MELGETTLTIALLLTVVASIWLFNLFITRNFQTHFLDISRIVKKQKKIEDAGALKNISRAFMNNRRTFGGYMCHIAILMIIVAAAGAVVYEKAETFNMRVGGTYSVGDYDFKLEHRPVYQRQ
jgi:cytochrome c-type biogenesis protein CcmF